MENPTQTFTETNLVPQRLSVWLNYYIIAIGKSK